MSSFEITANVNGQTVVFYGDEIARNVTDGAGNLLLHAPCYRVINPKTHTFDKRGVVNLNPDWTIRSLYWND